MTVANPYARLIQDTDEARREFDQHPVMLDGVANGMSLETFRGFLLELYPLVYHFCPIAAIAASRMPEPLREVRYFLYEHMHEESGHEQWVMNDLIALGLTEAEVLAYRPSPYTQSLIGYNHWSAHARHPASVLGMLYSMEAIAAVHGGALAAANRERLLLEGDAGTSFISSHSSIDVHHMEEIRLAINHCTPDEAYAAVEESTRMNFHHLARGLATLP